MVKKSASDKILEITKSEKILKNDTVILNNTIKQDNTLTATGKIVYVNGYSIRDEYYKANGSHYSIMEREVDKEGKVLIEKYEDQNKSFSKKYFYEDFDSNNNWTTRRDSTITSTLPETAQKNELVFKREITYY
jgi:hypothetical protein